jgi:hypothetical protein
MLFCGFVTDASNGIVTYRIPVGLRDASLCWGAAQPSVTWADLLSSATLMQASESSLPLVHGFTKKEGPASTKSGQKRSNSSGNAQISKFSIGLVR